MASLLLRLFHSDYFSPHLALSYLKTYSDNIGITYYLVSQLRTAFPSNEVEFYWPQLCHLLITKPSESRALECFVLQRCEESVHVALLTLWYFQAALSDLAPNPHTASFQVCQRVFNQCQRILFDDPLSSTSLTAAGASSSSRRPTFSTRSTPAERIYPSNALASLVGMGAVLASVPGMPTLADVTGKIAVQQGRRKPIGVSPARLETGVERTSSDDSEDDYGRPSGETVIGDDSGEDDAQADTSSGSITVKSATKNGRASREASASASSPRHGQFRATSGALAKGAPPANLKFAPRNGPVRTASEHIGRVQSAEQSVDKGKRPENAFASVFNDLKGKATAAVGDVFGQTFGFEATSPSDPRHNGAAPPWHPQRSATSFGSKAANSRSVPNLISARGNIPSFASTATLPDDAASQPEAVLAQYDAEARRRLLRSNYCRMQTEFLLSLQDISARLLLLPKPARLSALRAELTALNHKLPAEVCFPLWCNADARDGQEAASTSAPATSFAHSDQAMSSGRHHRVVRINPSEAVVLNSADRVPFLLHVEILRDDLDFDPMRRQNRESLKKLVVQEDTRRRKNAMSRGVGSRIPSGNEQFARGSGAGLVQEGLEGGEVGDRSEGRLRGRVQDMRDSSPAPQRGSRSSSGGPDTPRLATPSLTPASERIVQFGQLGGGDLHSSRPASPAPEADDEEIDLTEQAYGHDLAAFGEERNDDSSDDDDMAERNRSHDAAAWSHARSGGSPERGRQISSSGSLHSAQGSLGAARKKDFSLDEYSERMRTAAIMLAQLNQSTNAAAQPAVTYSPHVSATAQGGWSSWIAGTAWSGAPASRSEPGQGSAGVKAPINGAAIGSASPNPSAGSDAAGLVAGAGVGAVPNTPVTPGPSGGGSRLIHADTEAIRKRIMTEMMALEEERMERMKAGGRNLGRRARAVMGAEDEQTVLRAVNKDDPSAAMLGESWSAKKARIRASSPYGHLASWDVFSVIVKTGADLRQEQLAVQLVNEFGRIWKETGSRCWVRYFRILVTSESSGLMETVTDAVSIHSIKKEAYSRFVHDGKIVTYSLFDHYVNTYGDPSSVKFNRARDRFMESLAAYSIICYLLQIKDRHNGNILVDGEGHLIHIDFGFMLGISPGGVGFEAAPFKMPQEYIDILGGMDSSKFAEFKKLVKEGFRDVRKHAERIIMIVELMQKDSKLPCFALNELTAVNLRDRFQLALSQSQCDDFVDRLIISSAGSAFSRLYDSYQYYSQGIL